MTEDLHLILFYRLSTLCTVCTVCTVRTLFALHVLYFCEIKFEMYIVLSAERYIRFIIF